MKETNTLIFHQLLLIAQNLNFIDENENKQFASFLKSFISDTNLESQLTMRNNMMYEDDEEEFNINKIDDDLEMNVLKPEEEHISKDVTF